jgi:triacylglycerol lipase
MGGAVATLAALELHKMFKVQAVYSYGSPRVGNLEFAVEVSDAVKVHRVVLAKDIYPFLPPIWMGYYHVSTEVQSTGHIDILQ